MSNLEEAHGPVAILTGQGQLKDNSLNLVTKYDPPLVFEQWLMNRKLNQVGFAVTQESVNEWIKQNQLTK